MIFYIQAIPDILKTYIYERIIDLAVENVGGIHHVSFEIIKYLCILNICNLDNIPRIQVRQYCCSLMIPQIGSALWR